MKNIKISTKLIGFFLTGLIFVIWTSVYSWGLLTDVSHSEETTRIHLQKTENLTSIWNLSQSIQSDLFSVLQSQEVDKTYVAKIKYDLEKLNSAWEQIVSLPASSEESNIIKTTIAQKDDYLNIIKSYVNEPDDLTKKEI